MPTNNLTTPAPAATRRPVRPLPVVASPATGRGRTDAADLDASMRRHPAGTAVTATPPVVRVDESVFVPVLDVPLRVERPREVAP